MRTEIPTNYGPSGLAEVRWIESEGVLKVVAHGEEGDTIYPIHRDNVPDDLPLRSYKNVYFSLDEGTTKLFGLRPYSGFFPLKFKAFTRKGNDDEPYLKVHPMRWAEKRHESGRVSRFPVPEHTTFTALLEVIRDEDYAGLVIPYRLNYYFERDDSNMTKIRGRFKMDELKRFFRLAGIDLDDLQLPYESNVLVPLERMLLDANKEFSGQIKSGWIDELFPAQTGVVSDDVEKPEQAIPAEVQAWLASQGKSLDDAKALFGE